MMSTLVFVDPKVSTQADRAQRSRVPVPLPKDPYEDIRQAYLVGTDNESEPFEDPDETEAPKSPHTVAPPISLLNSTPPTLVPIHRKTARMAVRIPPSILIGLSASIAEVEAMSDLTFQDDDEDEDDREEDDKEEGEEIEKSLDSDSKSEGTEDESPIAEDEDLAARDEGLAARDEGLGMGVESLSLGGDEVVPGGQAVGSPGCEDSRGPERVSALRQPTLTTWINPEDGIAYIDVSAYPPPTPPSPVWSSCLLPISPTPSIVPSPISSPIIQLTIPSPVGSPVTAETEGFLTKLGARVEMQGGLIRDHKKENRELRVQIAEERRVRLDLAKIVDIIRREQDPIGDV
nr:hypothetical protein [Tanacetum cinerariifolium]